MKGVNVVTADQLAHWGSSTETVDGWKLARPMGRTGLRRRFAVAWQVFTGKYDALVWHKQ